MAAMIVCPPHTLDSSPTRAENCFLEASGPEDILKHVADTEQGYSKGGMRGQMGTEGMEYFLFMKDHS